MHDNTMDYLLIAAMGLATFLPRFLPLVITTSKAKVDGDLRQFLSYIPAAVLSGLVVPSILAADGSPVFSAASLPYLFGSLITFTFMLRTRRMVLSAFLGVVTFFVARFLVSHGGL